MDIKAIGYYPADKRREEQMSTRLDVSERCQRLQYHGVKGIKQYAI